MPIEVNPIEVIEPELSLEGMPPRFLPVVERIVQLAYADFEHQELPRPAISIHWHRNLENPRQEGILVVTVKLGNLGTRLQITSELLDIVESQSPIIPDQIYRLAIRMRRAIRGDALPLVINRGN